MYALAAAAISLTIHLFPPTAAPEPDRAILDRPAGEQLPSICPIPGWGGECARIDERQRQKIRAVVTTWARLEQPTCRIIHDQLVQLLADASSELWIFELHDDDTARKYVMGQAVRTDTGTPGFGLRVAAFGSGNRMLARFALHEAAHLAGEDENGARWVERHCVA